MADERTEKQKVQVKVQEITDKLKTKFYTK